MLSDAIFVINFCSVKIKRYNQVLSKTRLGVGTVRSYIPDAPVNRDALLKDFCLSFIYFLLLIALSLYMGYAPHEIYLGYCIEIVALIIIGVVIAVGLLILGRRSIHEVSIAQLLVTVVLLWFPFMFSMGTQGVADFSGIELEFGPKQFLESFIDYWPWLAIDLLLAVRIKCQLTEHIEALFGNAIIQTLRLFPNAVVSLLLAVLDLPHFIAIVAFHLVLAFPFSSLYRLVGKSPESAEVTEAKLTLSYLLGSFGLIFALPWLAIVLAFFGIGTYLIFSGQIFGVVLIAISVCIGLIFYFVGRSILNRVKAKE